MFVAPATESPAPPTHAAAGVIYARPATTPAAPVASVAAPVAPSMVSPSEISPSEIPPPRFERRDVILFQYCGRIQPGTVIEAGAECVWVKVGSATLRVPLENVITAR